MLLLFNVFLAGLAFMEFRKTKIRKERIMFIVGLLLMIGLPVFMGLRVMFRAL
jgi:hypothetical protein